MNRRDICEAGAELIGVDRATQYGDAVVGFTAIAQIRDALDMVRGARPRGAEDQALDMIAVKLVRASANPRHLDSWIDIVGYAALGGEIASESEP